MRQVLLFAPLVLALFLSPAAQAGGKTVDFSRLQQGCVEAGDVTFGPKGRWRECRLVGRDWVVTIGLLDFYRVQYCLGGKAGGCERRALSMFSNRAYNPRARLVLQRVDPGDTRYGDPLVVDTREGTLMVIPVHLPGGAEVRQHYFWRGGQWVAMDDRAWLGELARRLPLGTALRTRLTPDAETMSAQAPLYRPEDADCCPSGGVANVALGLANARFTVKKVDVVAGAECGSYSHWAAVPPQFAPKENC